MVTHALRKLIPAQCTLATQTPRHLTCQCTTQRRNKKRIKPKKQRCSKCRLPIMDQSALESSDSQHQKHQPSFIFPGPMPVSVTNDNLYMLDLPHIDWVSSEKTDGVRLLLAFLTTDDGKQRVVWVDRRCTLYNGLEQKFTTQGTNLSELAFPEFLFDGTLFDGELVRMTRDNSGRCCFLAFDMFSANSVLVDHKNYVLRHHVCQFTTTEINKSVPETLYNNPKSPRWAIHTKPIFYPSQYPEMMEHIKTLHHNTDPDGIIFTFTQLPLQSAPLLIKLGHSPDTTVPFNVMKMKSRLDNTIDFVIHFTQQPQLPQLPQPQHSKDEKVSGTISIDFWCSERKQTNQQMVKDTTKVATTTTISTSASTPANSFVHSSRAVNFGGDGGNITHAHDRDSSITRHKKSHPLENSNFRMLVFAKHTISTHLMKERFGHNFRRKLEGRVVECAWSDQDKCWVPSRFRQHKKYPNEMVTVKGTIQSLTDNIRHTDVPLWRNF